MGRLAAPRLNLPAAEKNIGGTDMKRFRKMIAAFLAVMMVLSGFTVAFAAENTTEFAGGEGTSASPYLVSNKAQLNNVRNYLGAYFKMTADITFDASDFASDGTYYNGGSFWVPIGTESAPFTGTFDGDGHVINGLKANASGSGTVYAGLFGYCMGTIENLGMAGGSVAVTTTSSYAYGGGVAGYNGGTVNACYNTGTVIAESDQPSYMFAGGVVGYNHGGMIECKNAGVVTARSTTSDAGGIAGKNEGTISGCFNTGYISGKALSSEASTFVGGIAAENSGAVSCCYNSGNLTATGAADYVSVCVGGMVGMTSGTVSNCFNAGEITASSYARLFAGGIFGYLHGQEKVDSSYNVGRIKVTSSSQYTYVGGIAGSPSNDAIKNCFYINTVDKGVGDGTDTATKCTAEDMKLQATYTGFDFTNVWAIGSVSGYSFPTLRSVPYTEPAENTTEFAGGNGTLENPYLILNKAQLNNVRNYLGAHFKMTSDITFDASDFASDGTYYNQGSFWMPIGTYSAPFTGTFDGNGHVISGLQVNASGNGNVYAGLFGCSGGIIKNLGMMKGNMTATVTSTSSKAYAGGVAGEIFSGTVDACYNTGNVAAMRSGLDANAGGIAGFVTHGPGKDADRNHIGDAAREDVLSGSEGRAGRDGREANADIRQRHGGSYRHDGGHGYRFRQHECRDPDADGDLRREDLHVRRDHCGEESGFHCGYNDA